MAIKLSSLIERQLPEFISTHYAAFSTFLEKYYESLEISGQPLDILSNITSYYDIDFYTKNIIEEGSTLATALNSQSDQIELSDAKSFPNEYGYVKINDEICFYTEKVGNVLTGVYRGVSGNTKLGDLYNKTNYVSTKPSSHLTGSKVENISNLFLFAILKSFESQYLSSIPTKYLKKSVDKRTLIKNITDFYKAKGSEQSIEFIFNSLVSDDPTDKATIRRPSEQTLKASDSDWISNYEVNIRLISGDPMKLIGEEIIQQSPFASLIVDNVKTLPDGSVNLIVDRSSVNGTFDYYGFTELLSPISSSDVSNFTIEVVSTRSWRNTNNFLYIGNEVFTILDRNVNQFVIQSRSGSSTYSEGTKIYTTQPYNINGVKFQITSSVYSLTPSTKIPYSIVGDPILESASAKSSVDTVVYSEENGEYRWIGNQNRQKPSVPTLSSIQSQLSTINADVSALFEDENYFYVCSSGYPSTIILDGTTKVGNLEDNKYLKLIRKTPITNTELYKTDYYDVGVLVDGSLVYGTKSSSFVKYGKIETVNILNKGSGYTTPPVVLINNSPVKARAILSGTVVSDLEILTDQIYQKTPSVVITSGRKAQVRPVITGGKITSLVIENAGEYYVTPPEFEIRDFSGRGKFARIKSEISSNGRLIGYEILNPGNGYSSSQTVIDVVPIGKNAEASVELKKWYKNRYEEITQSQIDLNGGALVDKKFGTKKTYAIVSNPRRLRYKLSDNINSLLSENKITHSKILGFAYDGNPIYGPYGYSNPLDPQSGVERLQSGYALNSNRETGPSIVEYPLGTFDEDYTWIANIESGKLLLDENNGRYCVTPEYPNGIYAYFVSIDVSGNPQYPYIIGKNYYSVPVDSNYNSQITQNEIPRTAKLLDFSQYLDNGKDFSATVSAVQSGNVSAFQIDSFATLHSPKNKVFVDNQGTDGSDLSAEVGSVYGVDVEYLKAKKSVGLLTSSSSVYLFDKFILRQQNTLLEANVIGDVLFESNIFVENISAEFSSADKFDLIDPDTGEITKVLSILLPSNGSFTANSELILTDGFNNPDSTKATGIVLETTVRQNTVRVKVVSGDFNLGLENASLKLRSSTLSDSVGLEISSIQSLSEDIEIVKYDYNFAVVKTEEDHNLKIGNSVDILINPDDAITEKRYYVRKKLFQEIKLKDKILNARLFDTGIGKISILNSGKFRSTGTFTTNLGNALVEVTISDYGDYNSISNITILDKGSGFEEDEIVFFNTELITDPLDPSKLVFLTDFNVVMELDHRFTARVDHVGLSEENTVLQVNNVTDVSQDDLLIIDQEILKVVSVNYTDRLITVERGQNGSEIKEHFNGARVSFYNFKYRFTPGEFIPEIGEDPSVNPKIFSYDEETNILTLSYEYGVDMDSTIGPSLTSFIKDNSIERKGVSVVSVGNKIFKLEFSENDESNFIVNPNITIQNFYKYKFLTGHPSMINTYLDFSPSKNYNIITQEKVVGDAEPGFNSPNSFVSLKFGFGPSLENNTYTEEVPNRFSSYYYFIKASGVETDNASLSIIQDPLSGTNILSYVTNNKFVYPIKIQPQENGSGNIKYTTSGENAIGIVNSISVINPGKNYKNLPIVKGIEVPKFRECSAVPNLVNGRIVSFNILNGGFGYIDAQIIVDGDVNSGLYRTSILNGSVVSISVLGNNNVYNKIPTIKVTEKSNTVYASSSNIGVPTSITIKNPGRFFGSDTSTVPRYTSTYAVLLSNIEDGKFSNDKTIKQYDTYGNVTFSGTVTSYRKGSNIVRFKNVSGDLSKKYTLNDATIVAILYTDYKSELKSFYDKNGKFVTPRGIISDRYAKLTDSYYYQDYSYVIRSKTPIDIWRDLVKDVVHPAGFELFGEVVIEAHPGKIVPVSNVPISPLTTTINAGVKEAFTINTSKIVTQRIVSCANTNTQRGYGRLALIDTFKDRDYSSDIYLVPEFDGYIDPITTWRNGTKTFTIYDAKTNLPITPYDENAVVVSLGGVVQEPKSSYTVSGSQITFVEAPLGPRISEGQTLDADSFVGKVFTYAKEEDSQKYFKKIKNIFQREGIWLDAANQIKFNKNFIVEETFGYITSKYPNTQFDPTEYKQNIGRIVDSYEHDIRFGGNSKTILSGELYYNTENQLTQSKEAYFYAAKLCAAAIRNWEVAFIDDPSTPDPEYEVIITSDSDIITVPSTFGLVAGMYVSSGSQFPLNTKIIEIIDETHVRVDNLSFSDIDGDGLFIFNVPVGSVTLPPGGSTEIEFNYNGIEIATNAELIISDGVTVTVTTPIALLRQVRFSLGKINTGTYVDAANLIKVNRAYIIDETISHIASSFPGFTFPGLSENKCRRDIGYLIDAITYHLLYGGNNRIVDYAEKYYLSNKLNYINDDLDETVSAFEYAIDLMLQAIQNPGPPFNTVSYQVVESYNVPLDQCQEVTSALNSYADVYTFILRNGPNLIQRSFSNPQKSGYYTNLLTYSNYNIIDDVELQLSTEINGIWFAAECANVVSSLYTLQQSLSDVLTLGEGSVEISTPDYFDGETTAFKLYTDNNEILKTEEGEDLLVFLNGVLQRPSAYNIIRSQNELETDVIQFTSPPKWDQNEAQLQLNQGTAVDYFHAFSIGPYRRRKIDKNKVNSSARLQIFEQNGEAVTEIIYDDRYHLVFVDGVLQRNRVDYNINQTKIIFNRKLNYFKPETGETLSSSVDIISLSGDESEDVITGFDFLPNEFVSVAKLDIFYSPLVDAIDDWYGSSDNTNVAIIIVDGVPLGTVINYQKLNGGVRFRLQVTNNPATLTPNSFISISKPNDDALQDIVFATALFVEEDLVFVSPETYVYGIITVADGVTVTVEDGATLISSGAELNFDVNADGNVALERSSSSWIFDKKSLKNSQKRISNRLTTKLLEGDKIKIDGESNYRKILKVPDNLISTQYNPGRSLSNYHYGNIIVTPSDEISPGAGLNIIPLLDENGRIYKIFTGKDNVLEAITKRQINIGSGYVRDTYVEFIPSNGEGGGALAKVRLWGSVVVDVIIIDKGYGYTAPPIPVITRGFDIDKSSRKASPFFQRTVNALIKADVFLRNKEINLFSPNLDQFNIFATFNDLNVNPSVDIRDQDFSLYLENNIDFISSELDVKVVFKELCIFENEKEPEPPIYLLTTESRSIIDKVSTITISTLEPQTSAAGLSLYTDSFAGGFFGPFNPETINSTQALVNIDFLSGDTILYVTNTEGFPSSGELQVGGEVVRYDGLLPDRFFIVERERRGTASVANVPIGTVVYLYQENININGVTRQDIHTEDPEVFLGPTAISEITTITNRIESVSVVEPNQYSQLSYYVEDETQNITIEKVENDILLQTQSINDAPIGVSGVQESNITILLDTTLPSSGSEINVVETSYSILFEISTGENNVVISESNVTLFQESDSDPLIMVLPEGSSVSEFIEVPSSFIDPSQTTVFVGSNTSYVELTLPIQPIIDIVSITASASVQLANEIFVDISSVSSTDSVSEIITIVEDPSSPTSEFTEVVVNASIVSSETEINKLISEIDDEIVYDRPIVAAQELTKYPEDVVSSDKDNLEVRTIVETTSELDLEETNVSPSKLETSIDVEIEQGTLDEFIEIINTDDIGLN